MITLAASKLGAVAGYLSQLILILDEQKLRNIIVLNIS